VNWLRYGVTPKCPHKGLVPGQCKGKAHRPEHLGCAGRRVLVSRKWSGKTLADHRGDRKAWLMEQLGLSATDDTSRYRWQRVTPSDDDYLPPAQRLLRVVAERMRWLSRHGARCRYCCRSVSPCRSPNPACVFRRTGLSTVSAVRRGSPSPRGWGSRLGSGNG